MGASAGVRLFLLLKKVCKKSEKNVICPLTYCREYVIIIVSRGGTKKNPGQKEVRIMKTIKLSTKALETINRIGDYPTRNWIYARDYYTGKYKRISKAVFDDPATVCFRMQTEWEYIKIKAIK